MVKLYTLHFNEFDSVFAKCCDANDDDDDNDIGEGTSVRKSALRVCLRSWESQPRRKGSDLVSLSIVVRPPRWRTSYHVNRPGKSGKRFDKKVALLCSSIAAESDEACWCCQLRISFIVEICHSGEKTLLLRSMSYSGGIISNRTISVCFVRV